MRRFLEGSAPIGLVALLTFIVLTGWVLDSPWLTTFGGPVPMLPTSAVYILAVAAIEWLRRRPSSLWADALAIGLTIAVALGAVMSLLDGPTLDVWLWPVVRIEHLPEAHMADATAAGLLMLCASQWMPRTGRLIAAGGLWTIVVLAYTFPAAFGVGWMAWPTMAAIIGLSVVNRLEVARA